MGSFGWSYYLKNFWTSGVTILSAYGMLYLPPDVLLEGTVGGVDGFLLGIAGQLVATGDVVFAKNLTGKHPYGYPFCHMRQVNVFELVAPVENDSQFLFSFHDASHCISTTTCHTLSLTSL